MKYLIYFIIIAGGGIILYTGIKYGWEEIIWGVVVWAGALIAAGIGAWVKYRKHKNDI